MALRKTLDFKGLTVESAYIRVTGVTINPGNIGMGFGVSYLADRDAVAYDMTYEGAEYKLEGGNPIRQAYDHLKTLEKFQGAEDC